MGKHIVVLNGSPRPNGNTTSLVREFTKGAESAGHTVVQFHLEQMNISGCKGCYAQGKSIDHPCVIEDDMDQIYPEVLKSDIVVVASPLYYWNLTGQTRTAIDRLFALEHREEGNQLRGHDRGSVLLMSSGSGDYEMVEAYFGRMCRNLQWKNLGSVLASGNGLVGDIEGKPELEEAYKLGASL